MNKALCNRIWIFLVTISMIILLIPTSVMANEIDNSNKEDRQQQEDYIEMLNYISFVNYEINQSSNNRLLLEQVYDTLYNDISPQAVDSRTKVQILVERFLCPCAKFLIPNIII